MTKNVPNCLVYIRYAKNNCQKFQIECPTIPIGNTIKIICYLPQSQSCNQCPLSE